eukprot:CAMPEP_0197504256 /NCGR_PEP_ID=MMETSP1312-20131121/3368_1 /TAXON_ID=464262 /ORGANISM="Genus nov. species nov., Strain RCC2335" /LENGTH=189 /DNA_ID=CAMNT_0043051091 /DNA_START=44 /DNA_END=611 /DNA_ORIENTATION=-
MPEPSPVFLELPALVGLEQDVAPSVELSLDVYLWEGRPLRVFLHSGSDPLVLQHVDVLERRAELVEDLDTGVRETALREHLGPLHEQHDLVLPDEPVDGGPELGCECPGGLALLRLARRGPPSSCLFKPILPPPPQRPDLAPRGAPRPPRAAPHVTHHGGGPLRLQALGPSARLNRHRCHHPQQPSRTG